MPKPKKAVSMKALFKKIDRGMIPEILQIEKGSFDDPWSEGMFLQELSGEREKLALALILDGELAGYVIGWLVFDEFHLGNIAVDPKIKGQGWGRSLLKEALDTARAAGCRTSTLEVRTSNQTAINLYHGFGYREIAIRKKYYGSEDALIMSADLSGDCTDAEAKRED
jgi:ribosomal-protein-alanine N-acetyltransferase